MRTRLILASESPRRRELLALLGLPFEVIPSKLEEEIKEANPSPAHVAEVLAYRKASHIFNQIYYAHENYGSEPPENEVAVLGADTIVVVERADSPLILNKPADTEDARRMLSMLSGITHTVYTGLSLRYSLWRWIEEGVLGSWDSYAENRVIDTQVTFRELTPPMIDAYITTGEPFDKAGAYGIQGYASAFVEAIYGDYFNVVGLPISTVAKMLEQTGIEWWRGAEALTSDRLK